MLKKILKQILGQKSSYKRNYSSSDRRYRKHSHHPSKHGHHYYKKKRGSSYSSYSS
ncbi:hypothetical protein [Domibacillus enclensis]|uniref:hypothetical protein n=1 Tax=Domibacillus enclensis TaxID=1017273 RepID=UPI000AA5039C|nr:hypothetical protein [Domibacillus enclensis]